MKKSPFATTRLWLYALLSVEVVEASSVDKDQMTMFLYLLIALFIFFILLIVSVCIHICRLSWAGLKDRRNFDDEAVDLADIPRQFHIRIDRATESRRESAIREQSL